MPKPLESRIRYHAKSQGLRVNKSRPNAAGTGGRYYFATLDRWLLSWEGGLTEEEAWDWITENYYKKREEVANA